MIRRLLLVSSACAALAVMAPVAASADASAPYHSAKVAQADRGGDWGGGGGGPYWGGPHWGGHHHHWGGPYWGGPHHHWGGHHHWGNRPY